MNTQTLLKQLEFIGACIEGNPVVPILKYALVDNGYLIGTNLRTTLMRRTDIEGTFLFPFKEVKKVVSILTKDDVCEIAYDKAAERVTLSTSSGTFIFNDIPNVSDFPKLPKRQEVEIGVLNSMDLHLIYAALSFASTDELRPAMSGIHISKHIAATDGHRLAWFEYSGAIKEGALLIDRITASALSGFGSASIIYDGGDTVEFHNNKGHVLLAKIIDERYPDYQLMIPKEHTTKVTISKEALLIALNLGIQMANKTTRQIILDFKISNGLTLQTKDLDFDTKFEYSVPCVVEGSDMMIAFDGVYLKSILTAIDDEEITLKLTNANKCGIVNDGFLLMPIMITEYTLFDKKNS
jgi:DNA polymerase-3 subunit beta